MTPPHPNDQKLIVNTADTFIRETELRQTLEFDRLIEILRLRKTTGELCVCFNQGGIRRIWLREKTEKIRVAQAEKILEILNLPEDFY